MAEILVSASTGAMGSLLGKLGTMLTDEYKLLKGVHDDIKFLKAELEAMQKFLIMMAEEEKPDELAKLRADAVREMSYEIEDNIDKFLILVEHEPSSKSDVFGKLIKTIKDIKIHHKMAKDVKEIKSQVEEINKRYERYKMNESSKSKNVKVDPRILAVNKDATELVGIKGPTDELLRWLSDKEGKSAHQLAIVSIVGCGGLGKTTLAKQVYDKLGANFECRAFVSISRNPDMMKILKSILSQIQNKQEAHARSEDLGLIIGWIKDFLRDKRYFIIIDDVWDIRTWKTLDCALVKNGCGSVIMTTTRMNDVAKSCCSSLAYSVTRVHEMKPLGAADSKKLFFKRFIFGCEEKCPPNLKEVSEDILKKCGGLPLAINAISSLLATGKTEEEWYRVRSSIGFAQGKNHEIEDMNYILSLSYIDLPLYLRSCLLYLTLFPEDYKIKRQRLIHRWISEGFIHGEDGQDLVELGETYFHELVNRSLIQPVLIGCDGKVTFCRVHDTVLDFLLYKSTEENFCTMLSNHSKPDSRVVRRLSLMGNEDQGSVEQLDLSHARSLGAFGRTQEYLPSLAKSNALRVLDLEDCRGLGNHHVKDIGRLFQLRYLSISFTGISELPGRIENLKYLETLDVSRTKLLELPETVTRLKRLARLFVPGSTKLPDGIGDMENLQELGDDLYIFVQSLNFLEELGKLTNLRKLSIIWDTRSHPSVESDEECYKEKKLVSSLRKLETCKLRALCIKFMLTEKDATFIAHPFFPALPSIREIHLYRGQLCWITKWMLSLVNLEILSIYWVGRIEQQDVEMVGTIPTLLEFRLLSPCLGPIIIRGGFQRLQVLELGAGVTELTFEAGAMPNLKMLVLHIKQSKLKCVDGWFDLGIQHLSSLAFVRVSLMDCRYARTADVEATESGLKSMIDAHPNRPTLQIERK